MMKPEILVTSAQYGLKERLEGRFTVHQLSDYPDRVTCLKSVGAGLEAILHVGGMAGVSRSDMEGMPKLKIISVMSAGHDYIDSAAARERGIMVTNGGGANAIDCAEFAFGLLLDAGRNLHGGDRFVREGRWGAERMPLRRRLTGRPLGILGLGSIGIEVAKRAVGFDMPVAYHNRRRRPDLPYDYYPDALSLARAVDLLIVVLPGGSETHHMIHADHFDALGPEGVLVNIGRGSVIDEQALISALASGRLGAAGLDVLEFEPNVPEDLAALPNVVLTPHQASLTTDAILSAVDRVVDNVEAFFEGRPVLTPVF